MNVRNALTNELNRYAILGLIVSVVMALGTYVFVKVRMVYDLQVAVRALQADVFELQAITDSRDKELAKRLDGLEQEVFGKLVYTAEKAEEAHKIPRVQPWQVNRDQELRERIRQLELWRLKAGP